MIEHTKVFIQRTAEDKKDDDKSKRTVYINIKFPEEIIDITANKLGTATTLCFMNTSLFIKAPYDNNSKHCFLKFDADERVEAIESYLQ